MLFLFSALTLLVGQQEGHLACEKVGVSLLVVAVWLQLCNWCAALSECANIDNMVRFIAPHLAGQKVIPKTLKDLGRYIWRIME